jgi:SMC interacting uncharacterized protein involved in chromosome segregation
MRDDEQKIKNIEVKIRDNEDYIEKLMFEQNEFKMKAHKAETSNYSQKVEIEKLTNSLNSYKMEKNAHEQLIRQRE